MLVHDRRRRLDDTRAKLERGHSGITAAFVALAERQLAEAEAELAAYTVAVTHRYVRNPVNNGE